MQLLIRAATPTDLPAMVDLLLRDAQQRGALEPSLWAPAADASARLERVVSAALNGSNVSTREVWRVADVAGRLVGIAHAMIVPAPPIYGVQTAPGLFLDDCFAAADAPPDTAQALLMGTEDAQRAAGAGGLVASSPTGGTWRALYERHGYEPVTLYMVKRGFSARALESSVRSARQDDVPDIVKRSAEHRRTLAELNPRFWPVHPDANSRFEGWMRYSLTLTDRDMLVVGSPGEVRGYVIAQPIAPLLVPAAHDITAVGVIDDFYHQDFANVAAVSDGGAAAGSLLSAAESAFVRRAFDVVLAVCPAAWTSKISVLERNGYRSAKLWMLKR